MSTQVKPLLTPEQYLEIERAAESKSEYFHGRMFAMSGGSLNHARLVRNLIVSLDTQLRGRRCEVAASDLRLRVSPDGLYTYPDIVVFCGPPQFADDRTDTIVDATVIVEVLSPSTENYDRGFKFEQYRRLSSLQDYLVMAQDRVHVECATRQEDDSWLLRETSDLHGTIQLPSIECSFSLADAYRSVQFARDEP
jgi:Uma2 family endonuclease